MSAIVRISCVIAAVTVAVAIAFTPSTTGGTRPRLSISSRSRGTCTGTPYRGIHSRLFDGFLQSSIYNIGGVEALEIASAFVKSIMENEYEPIPDSDGMSVLKNVVKLETGEASDVVLRSITIPFWQQCLNKVNTPQKRYKVAAIGTPGIGKSTSTPILIRMLLKEGKTVVYLVRSLKEFKWYYEFVPGQNNTIVTNVYPEKINPYAIPSLRVKSTYFIVDPGSTKDDCNPPSDFKPKVILVPSPDSGHWGGSEFKKTRDSVRGFFKFMPIWSLEELLSAWPVLCPAMTEEEVRVNYRTFGGVPRNVFGTDEERSDALSSQDKALTQLSSHQATQIAEGEMDAINSFESGDVKSNLMGYDLSDDDNGTYSNETAVLLSPVIAEKLYSKHMVSLWETMISQGKDGWKIFEAYTRSLMMKKLQLTCRPCVGMKDKQEAILLTVGGCTEICLGINPISDAKANTKSNILYHSARRSNPLFDFVYKEANGHFHVFQATVGTKHTANPKLIEALQKEVGGASKLSIYYLVPSDNFQTFVTMPVNPKVTNKLVTCNIWHVLIPKPRSESKSLLASYDTVVSGSETETAKPIATKSISPKAKGSTKHPSKHSTKPSKKKTKSSKNSKEVGDVPS